MCAQNARWYPLHPPNHHHPITIFFQVRNGTLDVAAFPLLYSNNWKWGNELSVATCSRSFYFVTTYPKIAPAYLTLVEPLSWKVWVALVATIICMAAAFYLQTRVMSWCVHVPKQEKDKFLLTITVIGGVINEAVPNELLSLKTWRSKQLLLVFWIPVACLIGMAYQSNLLSSLVKVRKEKPIDTFQDILDNGMTMFIMENSIVPYLMDSHPNPTLQLAHQKLSERYTVPDAASLTIKAAFDIAISRHVGRRHLYRAGKELDIGTFPCGYYYGINHPIQKSNDVLHIFLQAGIVSKITKDYFWIFSLPEREFYRHEEVEEAKPLSVIHLWPL